MNPIQYIPYREAHNIDSDELIVVDSHYARGLVLAHVYEERTPSALRGNTSTDATLNWLQLPEDEQLSYIKNPRFVTCNHFDIDGFLAVGCVTFPELALGNMPLLRAAATLGDFREFDLTSDTGKDALKLCALINNLEANNFCRPFGDLDDATIEHEVAEQKFPYFLLLFENMLLDVDSFDWLWKPEYDEVIGDIEFLGSGLPLVEELPNIDLTIISTPLPLHYYAAFSSVTTGAVLTHIMNGNYFEFEYRYETRVQRVDRVVKPRRDLSALADQLTNLESNPNIHWTFDNIQEGGPMLRPEFRNRPLTREERYQSMSYRHEQGLCPSSSLKLQTVKRLLEQALAERPRIGLSAQQ